MRTPESYLDVEALRRSAWVPEHQSEAVEAAPTARRGPDAPPARPGSRRSGGAAPRSVRGPVWWLLAVPAVITVLRLLPISAAESVTTALDLTTLPVPLLTHVQSVLLVPVGALVVVIFRLTLGVRALGVLSPVLLGAALPAAGLLPGLAFLGVAVAGSTLVVRPVLRSHGLPFSARVAALLSVVAILMLVPLLALRNTPAAHPEAFAYLPPVALGLVTERFAATAHREGLGTAAGRTVLTCLQAVVIGWVGAGLGLVHVLARHPELLLLQVWAVVVVSTRLSPRLVERHLAPRVATWWRDRRPPKGSPR